MRKLRHSTVQRKAWTLAQFFAFLTVRYQAHVHALTGHMLVQPIDEFNRPAKSEDGTPRIPPAEVEVDQPFVGWRSRWARTGSSCQLRGTTWSLRCGGVSVRG